MKPAIPPSRENDVLFMYEQLLTALEHRAALDPNGSLDRHLVGQGYNILNDIGYNHERPVWERRKV